MKQKLIKLLRIFTLLFGIYFGMPLLDNFTASDTTEVNAHCQFGPYWVVYIYDDTTKCNSGGLLCCGY